MCSKAAHQFILHWPIKAAFETKFQCGPSPRNFNIETMMRIRTMSTGVTRRYRCKYIFGILNFFLWNNSQWYSHRNSIGRNKHFNIVQYRAGEKQSAHHEKRVDGDGLNGDERGKNSFRPFAAVGVYVRVYVREAAGKWNLKLILRSIRHRYPRAQP